MKRFFLIALAAMMPFLSFAQTYKFPVDSDGDIEFYQEIENRLSKSELYDKAEKWVKSTFGDEGEEAYFKLDKAEGRLYVNGINPLTERYDAESDIVIYESLLYDINIECEDNKYSYKINNLIVGVVIEFYDGEYIDGELLISDYAELIEETKADLATEKEKLDSLYSIDTESLKAKALNKHNKELELTYDKVDYAYITLEASRHVYDQAYLVITDIIVSLKKAMN